MVQVNRIYLLWASIFILYVMLVLLGLWYGRYPISFHDLVCILTNRTKCLSDPLAQTIVVKIRLSRLALATVVGVSLATSGVVFQGLLRNPLADPFTLGVSTGAAFGATVAMIFGLSIGWSLGGLGLLPLICMAGAVVTLMVVIRLSRTNGMLMPAQMILAGIVVSTFLSALISLFKSLEEESLSAIVFWMLGSFSGRGWVHAAFAAPYVFIGLLLFLFFARELDIMTLGDSEAYHLGVDVSRTRFILLVSACLSTGAAVAVSGVIGFIGLVVPHLVRMIQGPRHRSLLVGSALLGALLMVASDLLAQNLLSGGEELPVGVITTLIGGPFFCYILSVKKREII